MLCPHEAHVYREVVKEEKGQLGWEHMNKSRASSWCPRVGVHDVTDAVVDYGYMGPKGSQCGAET